MKRRFRLLAIMVAGLAAVAFAPMAQATPNTKVDVFQDCSAGCPEPIDFAGPTGFGFINFNQDNSGVLRVVVSLKNASPNTTYTIYLTCGQTHATACGYAEIATVTTNGVGNGNSGAISIDVATQHLAGNASGAATDHIDMIGTDGSVLVGGGINFTVP